MKKGKIGKVKNNLPLAFLPVPTAGAFGLPGPRGRDWLGSGGLLPAFIRSIRLNPTRSDHIQVNPTRSDQIKVLAKGAKPR